MSISTLVNAIDNLAKEKSPNMFPLHVHKIISGVQEIGYKPAKCRAAVHIPVAPDAFALLLRLRAAHSQLAQLGPRPASLDRS